MNAVLSAIAEREDNPRYMPPPPSAHHDHGNGRVEEVPLVSRAFLLTCGTVALYLVLQELDAKERFDATTKEELADLIMEKTRGSRPSRAQMMPPLIPPSPSTARQKRFHRQARCQVKQALKDARRHGKF